MPPALADAMQGNLQRMKDDSLRSRLQARILQFRQGAQDSGLPLMPSLSPIQPLLIGSSDKALQLSSRLREAGLWVSAIRPPTVPQNEARLRVTLSAAHTAADVDLLLSVLSDCWQTES